MQRDEPALLQSARCDPPAALYLRRRRYCGYCRNQRHLAWDHARGRRAQPLHRAVGHEHLVTNLHLWHFVKEAQRSGAKVVVIDPVKTRTAEMADWHVRPLPGTDAALALGMMHVIVRDGLHDEDYVARHTVGFDQLHPRLSEYPPDASGEHHRAAAGGDRGTSARLRHHAARGHPPADRHGAPQPRGHGLSHHCLSPRSCGRLAGTRRRSALHHWAPAHAWAEPARGGDASARRPVHPLDQHGPARARAHRSGVGPAHPGVIRLQQQSRRHRSEPEPRAQGSATRGFVLGGGRAVHDRHRAPRGLCPPGHYAGGASRSVLVLGPCLPHAERAGYRTARRSDPEYGVLPPPRAAHGLPRCVFQGNRRGHGPRRTHQHTSVRKGHHVRAPEAARMGAAARPGGLPAIRRRRVPDPIGQV